MYAPASYQLYSVVDGEPLIGSPVIVNGSHDGICNVQVRLHHSLSSVTRFKMLKGTHYRSRLCGARKSIVRWGMQPVFRMDLVSATYSLVPDP